MKVDLSSHKDLCALAVKWLKRPFSRGGPGCLVAFSETGNGWLSGEIPDAIGFRYGVHGEASVLVEVKTSRADFLADTQKPHRREPQKGMGRFRYFMAPEGLLRLDELPHGWGLVEITQRGSFKLRAGHLCGSCPSWSFETRNQEREIGLLSRMLSRIGNSDQLHQTLKDARNTNSRLIRENSRLRASEKSLQAELYALREQQIEGSPLSGAFGKEKIHGRAGP